VETALPDAAQLSAESQHMKLRSHRALQRCMSNRIYSDSGVLKKTMALAPRLFAMRKHPKGRAEKRHRGTSCVEHPIGCESIIPLHFRHLCGLYGYSAWTFPRAFHGVHGQQRAPYRFLTALLDCNL
jgi:hypothetical protein